MTIETAFTDPSVTGPNLLFNNGEVSGVTELYQPASSAAPGGSDFSWSITQWSNSEFFTPGTLSPNIVSPTLGTSVANWETPDGNNGVAVFGKPGNYVYQLQNANATLKDVLLQSVTPAPLNYTFDKQVTLTVQEGIAATQGDASQGPSTVGNCFTVAFNRPGSPNYDPSLPTISMFLQYGLTDQRGLPEALFSDGMYNIAPSTSNENEALPFQADGQMHLVTDNISAGVAQMAEAMYKGPQTEAMSAAGVNLLDLSRWSLTSIYVGSEVSPGTGVTVDVAHPVVSRDDSVSVNESAAATATQIQTVDGGVDGSWRLNGTGPQIAQPGAPALSALPQAISVSAESPQVFPFAAASILGELPPGQAVTLTATLSGAAGAVFEDSSLVSVIAQAFGVDTDLVTLSSDGRTLTINSTIVLQDLQELSVDASKVAAGASLSGAITLSLATPSGTTTTTIPLTVNGPAVAKLQPAAYTTDGHGTFVVTGAASATATIDTSGQNGQVTVFGGAAALDFSGENAVVVLNGPGQVGKAVITATGGNQVWLGNNEVDYAVKGASTLILGATPGQDGTLLLTGGSVSDSDEVLSWGGTGDTETVIDNSNAPSTVFGGAAALSYSGGHAVIVDNGAGDRGNVTVNSYGSDFVWAGSSRLDLSSNGGSDTVVGGSGQTVIHGASVGGGTESYEGWGGPGSIVVNGGMENDTVNMVDGHATVFAGSGQQQLSLAGSGSLVVVAAGQSTATQTVSVSGGASGSLQYWGGGATAHLDLGGGSAMVKVGSGNTTLTGGSGSLSLDLSSAASAVVQINGQTGGNADIYGFSPSTATVSIQDVTARTFVGGAMVVSLSDGHTVTFHDLTSQHGITLG